MASIIFVLALALTLDAVQGSWCNDVTPLPGVECQRWDSQYPHKHVYTPEKYPELSENYCANPNNSGARAWCYTTSDSIRWKFCDCIKDKVRIRCAQSSNVEAS